MTTQNAGTSEGKGFDPDEAERLASMIRPAWEGEGDDNDSEVADLSPGATAESAKLEPGKLEPTKVEPAKVEPVKVEAAKPQPTKAEVPRIAPSKAEPSTKTAPLKAVAVTETSAVSKPEEPTIEVSKLAPAAGTLKAGDTLVDSGPRFSDASADAGKPAGAKPTQLGLGDEDATEAMDEARGGAIAAAAKALSDELEASPPKGAPTSVPAPAADPQPPVSGLNKAMTRTLALEAAPLTPAKPRAAGPVSGATRPSLSRADDPVEIPVRKSSVGLFVGVGAAVLLLGLGGYAIFGGSSDTTAKPKPTADTATAAPKETPKPATTVTATVTQTAAPIPTATATASASAAPTATAEPTASVKTSEPVAVATAPAPKPTTTTKPQPTTTTKPQPTGTTKPGGGGIIREVPF